MTLKTVTWRRNQHHILWVWISVSNHNGGEGFLINLQPAPQLPHRGAFTHHLRSLYEAEKCFISTHTFPQFSSVCSWTCREPQRSQVEQRGKYSYCGSFDDRWGRDISEPCEAAFLCCKGLVVTHPSRVSCYFHFFPSQQLINIFTSVPMDFMVFLDAFLNWEVTSPESRVLKGFLS